MGEFENQYGMVKKGGYGLRYHLLRFLRWPGVRYKMLAHRDHHMVYFEDQTLMGEILEVLERKWYKRLIRWPWFGWEIEANEREVAYYFWAPNVEVGDEIRRKILGKHPDMDITRVMDLAGEFSDCGFVTATSMKLDRDYMVPIKTFYNEVVDSQAPIVNAMSDLGVRERCLVQVLIQPARKYQKDFDKAIQVVKRWDKKRDDDDGATGKGDEYEKIELFETNIFGKQTKQLGHCVIRVMSGAKTKKDASRIRNEVTRSFGQFKSEALNSFVSREKWTHIKPILLKQVKHRLFPMLERRRKRVILNIEELSAVVRLPSKEVNNSRLTRLVLKQIQAPSGVIKMASDVRVNGPGARYVHIGLNDFRMKKTDVFVDLKTLNQHMFVGGASGTGKSVLLTNFLLKLCQLKREGAGNVGGFFLIDPLGGVAQQLASNIPDELLPIVNYVQPDPLKKEHFPFNLFDVDFTTTAHSIAKNIGNAVGRIWPEGWGPRPEQNFLIGGMILQRIGEASIINLEKLLRDVSYTVRVYKQIQDQEDLVEKGATDFLLKVINGGFPKSSAADKRARNELIDSTLNKLIHFTMSELLNGAMGAKTSGFRWLESMDNGYINILDLSKVADDHEKRMLGSLALTMNYQAAISRVTVEKNTLYPIIVDEFPMFIEANADVIQEMADKTRQKMVPIVGAAQGIITQLDSNIADAIGRNFTSHIIFRMEHPEDSKWMSEKFNWPDLRPMDIQNTPSNYAYAKLGLGRESSTPFTVLTNPPSYNEELNVERLRSIAEATLKKAQERERKFKAGKLEVSENDEQIIYTNLEDVLEDIDDSSTVRDRVSDGQSIEVVNLLATDSLEGEGIEQLAGTAEEPEGTAADAFAGPEGEGIEQLAGTAEEPEGTAADASAGPEGEGIEQLAGTAEEPEGTAADVSAEPEGEGIEQLVMAAEEPAGMVAAGEVKKK